MVQHWLAAGVGPGEVGVHQAEREEQCRVLGLDDTAVAEGGGAWADLGEPLQGAGWKSGAGARARSSHTQRKRYPSM